MVIDQARKTAKAFDQLKIQEHEHREENRAGANLQVFLVFIVELFPDERTSKGWWWGWGWRAVPDARPLLDTSWRRNDVSSFDDVDDEVEKQEPRRRCVRTKIERKLLLFRTNSTKSDFLLILKKLLRSRTVWQKMIESFSDRRLHRFKFLHRCLGIKDAHWHLVLNFAAK